MSSYSKEKNFIIINLNGVNGAYRLDINTGIYYGISGKPIKTCPRRFDVRNMFCYPSNNIGQVLEKVFDTARTEEYPYLVKALQTADKIDALGLGNLRLRIEYYEFIGDNFKDFVAYIHELANEQDGDFSYRSFVEWLDFQKAKKKYGSTLDQLNSKMYQALKREYPDITKEELSVSAYYLTRGKYWEYHGGDVHRLVSYLRLCKFVGKVPEKVNNFMREFCETKKLYELRKVEYDNKMISFNYARQEKAWRFEYDNHIVLIPTSAHDIITEGEKMHHCVGSYVDRVLENSTYICFVRRKDSPDTPYITCQVDLDGNIRQYYLAYDQYISTNEDRLFKEMFQRHLRSVWVS